jgi:outer membrane protein TolC
MNIKYLRTEQKIKPTIKLMEMIILLLLLSVSVAIAQTNDKKYSLEECIQIALQNNPGIISSSYSVDESAARVDEARSGYFPSVNINSSFDRVSNEGVITSPYNNYNAGVSARYYLFQGLKTNASVNAANYSYQASSYQHEVNKQDMILKITQGYYRMLQSGRLIESADKTIERAKLFLDYANAKFKSGLASRSDILKAEVEFSNSSLTFIKVKNDLLAAKGNLNLLLGLSADAPIFIIDDLAIIEQNQFQEFDELKMQSYQNRPELKKFNEQLNVQKSSIQIAKGDFLPTLSADASYNYGGTEISSLKENWVYGLTLSIPLFSGFSTKARVAEEEIALKGLEKQFESLSQQVSLDVWNAYLNIKETDERIINAKTFLENAQENLRIAEGQYREGAGSMIEVIDAQTNYVIAEQTFIQSLADYKVAVASLKRATGINTFQEN